MRFEIKQNTVPAICQHVGHRRVVLMHVSSDTIKYFFSRAPGSNTRLLRRWSFLTYDNRQKRLINDITTLKDLSAKWIPPPGNFAFFRFITKSNATKRVQQWIMEILIGAQLNAVTTMCSRIGAFVIWVRVSDFKLEIHQIMTFTKIYIQPLSLLVHSFQVGVLEYRPSIDQQCNLHIVSFCNLHIVSFIFWSSISFHAIMMLH